MSQNINIYPEKNKDIIVRWVVEEIVNNGQSKKYFCESEEKAGKIKSQLLTDEEKESDNTVVDDNAKEKIRNILNRYQGKEIPDPEIHKLAKELNINTHAIESYIYSLASKEVSQEVEIDELVNDNETGLIDGDKPNSVGPQPSNQITSKSTTDDVVNTTRQGVSRWFSYRRFYGEGVEDGILTPLPKKIKNTPIGAIQSLNAEINEVDKTAEALGGIYADSTDPIDFERKAAQAGYDKDEITKRQERFFRKTSEDQQKTNNTKIPLEEVDIAEDVLTTKQTQGDFVTKTMDDRTGGKYSIPYYDQLKQKDPIIARKLVYLVDSVRRENMLPKDKASLIWQFLQGVGIDNLRPEDKQYLLKYLQYGE